MIIVRRMFSNKEQKALRRKYDFEQGLGSSEVFDDKKIRNANAKAQARMMGFDKTTEIINDAEKRTKTTTPATIDVFGIKMPNLTKEKETTISVKNKKELDEIERARDIIREGRKRSRSERKGYTFNTATVDNSERSVLDRAITSGRGGINMNYDTEEILRKKLKEREDRLAKEATEKAKQQKIAKIKKAAPYITAGALAAGATVASVKAYKHHKNKKKDKE